MSKKYLNIGEHGLNGDFYSCDNGPAFRADNLSIATKIAFNNWLSEFNPLYRECSIISITDGSFTVSITEYREETYTETHTVKYHGPANMYTIQAIHSTGDDWYKQKYSDLEKLAIAGDTRVRMSKSSGMVMFNVTCFPRWRSNGEWWDREHTFLSTDRDLAIEQLEYVFATDNEKTDICKRNYNAMIERDKKIMKGELTND
jgi:hypothetical protein